MGVIITSAKYINALAAVRCMGKHNIKIACGDSKKGIGSTFPKAFYSKYCNESFIYPDPDTNPSGFIDSIIKFAKKNEEYNVLMPIDSETLVISKYKRKIENAVPNIKIPIHEYKYLEIANDKRKVIKLANDMNIPAPKTFFVNNLSDIKKISNELKYPVVIKLPSSKGSKGIRYIYNKGMLSKEYENVILKYSLHVSEFPMIQEYINGEGYGVECLFDRGVLIAKHVHRRIRELPITGGVSVARVSTTHKEMEDYATNLLKRLKWHGVAMVEFKLDKKDGTPKIMEINPRFWGSLNQAISAGVEFPYLLYKIAMGESPPQVFDYKLGIKTRYLSADIRATMEYLIKSNKKFEILKDFLDFRNTTFDDFSFDDSIPSILQIVNPIISLIKRGKLTDEE